MARHAHPWSLYRIYIDQNNSRTRRGRHAKGTSSTHIPAWPFNRSTL